MKSPWITALRSVALTVPDLAAAEDFYTKVWRLDIAARGDGVLYLRGTFGSSTRVIAAGTVLTVLPTLAAFLFTQRFFMRGMDGAVK